MAKKQDYPESDQIKLNRAMFNAMFECFKEALEPMITMNVQNHPVAAYYALNLTAAAFADEFNKLENAPGNPEAGEEIHEDDQSSSGPEATQ